MKRLATMTAVALVLQAAAGWAQTPAPSAPGATTPPPAVPAPAAPATPTTPVAPSEAAPGSETSPPPAMSPTTKPMRHKRMSMADRFNAANTSKDGHLTLDQAKAAHWPYVVRHFDAMDKDKKGYLTTDDIHAYAKANRATHHRRPKPGSTAAPAAPDTAPAPAAPAAPANPAPAAPSGSSSD